MKFQFNFLIVHLLNSLCKNFFFSLFFSQFRFCFFRTLPPDFPQTIPSLQVSPTVQHPLVSSSTSFILPTAHENLTRWTPHVSLGKTIYEIVQKFMQQPPTIGILKAAFFNGRFLEIMVLYRSF